MGFSVNGKTAIITGAGSGINLEFARLLLQNDANVVFADIALRLEAKELVDEYSSDKDKPQAIFQQTDVTDWKQLDQMFQVAMKYFGTIDIVCPGAGVYEPHWSGFWYPPGSAESKDAVDGGRYAQLDINLTHPIRSTQLAISYFIEQRKKTPSQLKFIIHISSIAGQSAGFGTAIYVATKHAINGFVRSLAPLEQEYGIRVAAVAPGVIRTPLWTDHPEKLKFVTERDEWVLPEEVGAVMLALIEKDQMAEFEGEPETIEITGGTILEVSKKAVRDVKPFNDPGPRQGPGNTAAGYKATVYEDIQKQLSKPGWGKT
ncbi:putative short chain dehydrogenase reductase family [Phaeomoniella chlamydospora]|uniref:Putative short chain dehydrogenase reductase family n=1 Tax=Phaeomoniella chlamydospora TaxID=158046 RepID=A0A0G2E9K2_PHACM|nr:putative short chain dehydrogenase reductase family [Phaeomoniella chlamydospora]